MIDYSSDAPWPPRSQEQIQRRIAEWDAWASGDPVRLATAYAFGDDSMGSAYSTPQRPHEYRRSDGTAWSGGVVGWAHRMWWGEPVDDTSSSRGKLHIPLAGDIATASADLLFSEELGIDTSLSESGKARLVDIMDENNLPALLSQSAERGAATGQSWLRIVTDPEVSDDPIVDLVDASHAIPTFRWGRLVSVQFWDEVARSGGTVWRHIQEHTSVGIEHALFEGTGSHLGIKRELTLQPDTADLAVNAQAMVPTPGMSAFYVPNMLPNPDDPKTSLGASDYAGGTAALFDAVDEAWSSLMRDVKMGKARIIVPQAYLQQIDGPGSGSTFDFERELYVGMNMPPNSTGSSIESTQFQIRSEEHLRVIDAAVRQAIQSAGYSVASFGLDDSGSAQTATEVRAKRERSITTRGKKIRYWTNPLEDMLDYVARLSGLGEAQTVVEFPQAVAPTQLELAQVAQTMLSAQAASTRERVKIVHPNWDDDQVDTEAEAIDSANAVPDPLEVGRQAAVQVARQTASLDDVKPGTEEA